MPAKTGTVKIFLGNLSDVTTADDVRPLFEEHGKVVEADVIKNYGFVHMEDEATARAAIQALNGHQLHGKPMVVEPSTGLNKRGMARRGRPSSSDSVLRRCKIFVGNLHKDTTVSELRELFTQHGEVVEADIISNYAFVHMEDEQQAQTAIQELNGHQLHGQTIRIQMSTSNVRPVPGMDKMDICYRCGSQGHWSKDCGRRAPGGPPAMSGVYPPAYATGYSAAPADYQGLGRDRPRYAPYPSGYGPAPAAYRRGGEPAYYEPAPVLARRPDPYYDPAPPRRSYYEPVPRAVEYYAPPAADYYDDYELYERRGGGPLPRAPAAAPLLRGQPAAYDAYDRAAAAAAAAEPLYDRRLPAAYRAAPSSRHMY